MTRADRYVKSGNSATRMPIIYPNAGSKSIEFHFSCISSRDKPADDIYPKNITGITMSARLFQCVAIYDLGSSIVGMDA